MNNILTRRRALMSAKKNGGLPSIYQQVASINSISRGPYLNLGVRLTGSDSIHIKGYLDSVSNFPGGLFGASDGGTNSFVLRKQGDDKLHLIYGTQNIALGAFSANYISFEMDVGNGAITLTSNRGNFTGTYTNENFETNPIYLFSANGGGNLVGMRLDEFEIKDKLRGVPCYRKADNVIGLYNLVTGEFLTNAGTGTFGKGADI